MSSSTNTIATPADVVFPSPLSHASLYVYLGAVASYFALCCFVDKYPGPRSFFCCPRPLVIKKPRDDIVTPAHNIGDPPSLEGNTLPCSVEKQEAAAAKQKETTYIAPPLCMRWAEIIFQTAGVNAIQTIRGPRQIITFLGGTSFQCINVLIFFEDRTDTAPALVIIVICMNIFTIICFVQSLRLNYHLNYLVMVMPSKREKTKEEFVSEALGLCVPETEHAKLELERQDRARQTTANAVEDIAAKLASAALSGCLPAVSEEVVEPVGAAASDTAGDAAPQFMRRASEPCVTIDQQLGSTPDTYETTGGSPDVSRSLTQTLVDPSFRLKHAARKIEVLRHLLRPTLQITVASPAGASGAALCEPSGAGAASACDPDEPKSPKQWKSKSALAQRSAFEPTVDCAIADQAEGDILPVASAQKTLREVFTEMSSSAATSETTLHRCSSISRPVLQIVSSVIDDSVTFPVSGPSSAQVISETIGSSYSKDDSRVDTKKTSLFDNDAIVVVHRRSNSSLIVRRDGQKVDDGRKAPYVAHVQRQFHQRSGVLSRLRSALELGTRADDVAGLRMLRGKSSSSAAQMPHPANAASAGPQKQISSAVDAAEDTAAVGNTSFAARTYTAELISHLALEEELDAKQHAARIGDLCALMHNNFATGLRVMVWLLPPLLGLYDEIALLVGTAAAALVLFYMDTSVL